MRGRLAASTSVRSSGYFACNLAVSRLGRHLEPLARCTYPAHLPGNLNSRPRFAHDLDCIQSSAGRDRP